ncbi:MAG: hypothetical protein JW917_03395 [Ignavibacteria bacterium]|nr:hypothetical protein [Ignavibacteria bacterium]
MGIWGDEERGRWGQRDKGRWEDGEMRKWGNGKMGRWGNGDLSILLLITRMYGLSDEQKGILITEI